MKRRLLIYVVGALAVAVLVAAGVKLGAPAALTAYGHALFDPATPLIQSEQPAIMEVAKTLNDNGMPVLWLFYNGDASVVSIGIDLPLSDLGTEQEAILSSAIPYIGGEFAVEAVVLWFWHGHGNDFDVVFCGPGSCENMTDHIHQVTDVAWQEYMVDTHLVRPWPLN